MSTLDWISTVSSVVAAIIGLVTLLTVYIGARQLQSENRIYRLGLSWRSVGPWKTVLSHPRMFGLQQCVSVPTVSVKHLVQTNWKPNISFPAGFCKDEAETDCAEKGVRVQAKASWVNFMQALGLSPTDHTHYEMEEVSEFVNGITPMQWRSEDLASICSILGFQSFESDPSSKAPMALPMQWSGPLGWLRFQSSSASASGCVAQFRRRMDLHNQIDPELHRFRWPVCDKSTWAKPDFLRSRLWNSINGFALLGKETLFLGGTDKKDRPQDRDDEDPMLKSHDDFLKLATTHDYSTEEIDRMLFGIKENWPKALKRETARNMRDGTDDDGGHGEGGSFPNFFQAMLRNDDEDASKKKQVLRPCPGLLSVIVHSELAYNRGLSIDQCHEYDRKYVYEEDIDHKHYPYHLGDLYMDLDLLTLMKEALLLLQPDGFYFSPTIYLYQDIREVYQHIEEESNQRIEIFPEAFIKALMEPEKKNVVRPVLEKRTSWDVLTHILIFPSVNSTTPPSPTTIETLRTAMKLCNNFQKMRKNARACLTVEDMKLSAKASSALLTVLNSSVTNNNGQDIV